MVISFVGSLEAIAMSHFAVLLVFLIRCTHSDAIFLKCCDDDSILSDNLKCSGIPANINKTFFDIVDNIQFIHVTCLFDFVGGNNTEKMCIEMMENETIITVPCQKVYGNFTNDYCDSSLTILKYWGATMVVFATALYTMPYLILIIVYLVYQDLRTRAYDKSLLFFNICYTLLNFCLVILGSFEICHKILPSFVYGILGIVIIFLLQQTCMWLFAICFDITLVITRFQWAPGNNKSKERHENHKFHMYALTILAVSVIPTIVISILEFTPIIPENSIFRPALSNFHEKRRNYYSLFVYSLSVPVLMLFMNTILFIYTTNKMLQVQKDSAFLNKSNREKAKKKYFVYLKLYLIMDAPWLSGALSAIYPSLWPLKFLRVIQPILILYVTIPKKRIMHIFGCTTKTKNDKVEAQRAETLSKKTTLKDRNNGENVVNAEVAV